MEIADSGIGDDGHRPAGKARGERRAGRGEEPRADEDVIGAVAQRHGDAGGLMGFSGHGSARASDGRR